MACKHILVRPVVYTVTVHASVPINQTRTGKTHLCVIVSKDGDCNELIGNYSYDLD